MLLPVIVSVSLRLLQTRVLLRFLSFHLSRFTFDGRKSFNRSSANCHCWNSIFRRINTRFLALRSPGRKRSGIDIGIKSSTLRISRFEVPFCLLYCILLIWQTFQWEFNSNLRAGINTGFLHVYFFSRFVGFRILHGGIVCLSVNLFSNLFCSFQFAYLSLLSSIQVLHTLQGLDTDGFETLRHRGYFVWVERL